MFGKSDNNRSQHQGGSREALSTKGAWAIARHWVMTSALKNKTLKRYGFTLPWETATT